MAIQPGIKQAYAMFNGQKIVAVYDETTGLWTAEMTAPDVSSWNEPNHVYTVSLHAEDEAGNTTSVDSTDETYGDQLKIRVMEHTKPIAMIVSPTMNSVFGTSTQDISLELTDEGGSGLNMSTVEFKLNGVDLSSVLVWTGEGSHKTASYTAENLSDGINTITLSVIDNDGNASDVETVRFVVSTSTMTLSIETPTEGLSTNASPIDVRGTVEAPSSGGSVVGVTVNDDPVIINDGVFETTVALVDGENTIVIIATDSNGKTTSVVRHVVLDTVAPVITDVVAEATTVDSGGRIRITFRITEG